jgi:TnpA family transposase
MRPLDQVARHRIDAELIAAHWDDLLRVVGSLLEGSVRASQLLRALHGGGRPCALGRALGEAGRVAKTVFLLAYLGDEAYRRRILLQLNRGGGRHALARKAFPATVEGSCASPTGTDKRTSSAPSGWC